MSEIWRQVGWSTRICGTIGLGSLMVGVLQIRISGTSWILAFGPGILIITLAFVVARLQIRSTKGHESRSTEESV
jgi:hypothetical protein